MEEKYNNPKLTQKEICNQLGFTDRTIRRYRDDIKMDSPYRINNKKKTPKQKLDTKTENISKSDTNKKLKNNVIKEVIFLIITQYLVKNLKIMLLRVIK